MSLLESQKTRYFVEMLGYIFNHIFVTRRAREVFLGVLSSYGPALNVSGLKKQKPDNQKPDFHSGRRSTLAEIR